MRIGLRISLGCLGVAMFVAVVGWLSAVTHDAVRSQVDALRRSSVLDLVAATGMLLALKATHAAAQELVVETWHNRAEGDATLAGIQDIERATLVIENRLATFSAQHAASRRATETALALAEGRGDAIAAAAERGELALLEELGVRLEEHGKLVDELVALTATDPFTMNRFLEERLEPHYLEVMLPVIRQYQDDAEAELAATVAAVDAALDTSDRRNTIAIAAAGALAVLLGLLLARSIARPIEALVGAAHRIGGGDLDVRVDVRRLDEVGVLADTFNQMAERLQTTTVSKSYVDDIFRSMGEILLVSDAEGRIRTVNRAAEEQLGWTEAELVGHDVRDIVHPADEAGEFWVTTRGGSDLPVACTPTDLHDAAGRPRGRVWAALNIGDQKMVESELRRSVEEKEVLLREVHHRVKNNLQVICSLLQLQATDAAGPDVVRRLADSERRVRSMALIHEQLYRSRELARVDFAAYIDGLARNVLASAGSAGHLVTLHADLEPVSLDFDAAVLCGLILNELVSNAMKHAFPENRPGVITVRFQQRDGRATLTVADDGIGLAWGGARERPGSLGLRLVRALARQLDAETTFDGGTGTRVTVAFDLPAADGRHTRATAQA